METRFKQIERNVVAEWARQLSQEQGTATLIAVLVMALLGIFVAASLSRVTTGATILNNDYTNSKAFYAAQASLEEMSRNFSNIFVSKLTPTTADLNNVQNTTPNIDGFAFTQLVTKPASPNNGTVTIASGPFAGLSSLRTAYQLDSTATYINGAQVHLTRTFYNHQIPIFQFGIFYDGDLTIYPGPNMYFSGRVHSNGNIYVMGGSNVYFQNRVTAAGQIIRDWNRNGFTTSGGGWNGKVFIADATGTYQQLPVTSGGKYYGSAIGPDLTNLSGSALNPEPGFTPNNDKTYSAWLNFSTTTFGGDLLANQPALLLPFQVGTGRSDIELIKRGLGANDYQVKTLGQTPDDGVLGPSRYYNKPGIRVTLSDSQEELPGGTGGVRLDGASDGKGGDADADGSRGYQPVAMKDGYQAKRINGFRMYTGPSYTDNGSAGAGSGLPANRQTWIKVELVSIDSTTNAINTKDVTTDFLSLGMTDAAQDLKDASGNPLGDSRAILKIQRYEIPGAPVRVSDVNVRDGSNPNTATTSPTTANYVYSPGAGQAIAIGPYNVFSYQTGSSPFSYVSMTDNDYSPSMAGDPSSTTLNGYSLFTNLHQKSDGTLYYFNTSTLLNQLSSSGVAAPVSGVLGSNVWGTNAAAPGTTTQLPVNVGGFTSGPSYPTGYVMSSKLVPPSWLVTPSGTAGKTFKLTFGGQTTGSITYGSTLTAASIQSALAALSTIGSGNVLVTGNNGGPFTVYLSNPANWTATGLGATYTLGVGLTVTITGQASSTWSSASSIEGTTMGTTAKFTDGHTETLVPFPIEVFDPREAIFNDDMTISGSAPAWNTIYPNGTADKTKNGGSVPSWAGANIPAVGVMSLIDVDVANLRSFLNKTWDANFPGGLKSTDVATSPGWLLYVSDRRGDRDDDGEYDMEDIYGPQDGNMQPGEDTNGNGKLDVDTTWESALVYGNPIGSNGLLANNTASGTVNVPEDIAAFFDHQYFRRGVRLINGSQLPGDNNDGFTLASENPVYTLGNYNAQGIAVVPSGSGQPTQPTDYLPSDTRPDAPYVQVPASIAADAITVLSNAWEDGNAFRNPYANNSGASSSLQRVATETTVRAAFLMGATEASLQSASNPVPNCQGGKDKCLDGGVHNFPRFLENWSGRLNYCGSLINPFNSREALGAYKDGGAAFIYSPPVRNWSFDVSFLDPSRLPPGTPFFQFIQMTGFRQTTAQEQ